MSTKRKPLRACGGARAGIAMRVLALADEMEAIEAAAEKAGRSGDLTPDEARRVVLAMSWCWSEVMGARPRVARK